MRSGLTSRGSDALSRLLSTATCIEARRRSAGDADLGDRATRGLGGDRLIQISDRAVAVAAFQTPKREMTFGDLLKMAHEHELPLTTTLMLQSIADIARHYGEDLRRPEARLACLEVFALADRRSGKRADIGYYATRSVLTHLTADA